MNWKVRTTIVTSVFASIALVSFLAGRAYQHLRSGYFFSVIDEREYAFDPVASLRLQHATKSVGLPFLDPETSIVTLEPSSGSKTTLYEAERGFQESNPYVKDLIVAGSDISWADGKFRYHLRIESLDSQKKPQDSN